jgi:facilitated trehalose transporter
MFTLSVTTYCSFILIIIINILISHVSASILGFALIVGNFTAPTIMAKYGRRTANLVSILPMIIGWICIITANTVASLLAARFLQGVSMGMSATLGPVLIGEYTSPNNRGAFLTVISLAIAAGVLLVHTIGSYFTWQWTALVCCIIAFIDLIIVIYSPESPSWLADQGRYDDSRKVFRWLRGDKEEDELKEMIEASRIVNESKFDVDVNQSIVKKLRVNVAYFNATIKKKEFYKPIFIMIHIYTLGIWAGASILASYTRDVFENVIGPGANIAVMIITLDAQRIISNAVAVYVIKKIKRRTMLFATVGINLFAFVATAGYVYAKAQNMLPFDHPMIGILLIHIHMFSIATGTVPLPFIIAGELFPLEYRSLAGGISVFFLSFNLFITVKTFPVLLTSIGLHGLYLIYTGIVGYCLVIAGILLPETKDRTLQDIEDEFRGRPLSPEEMKSVQSLASMKLYNMDRRCSNPVL